MADSADIIRELESTRFSPVRLREGYDLGEVDAFLDRLGQAARDGQPFAPLVAAAAFTTVRLREGYDIGEVDALLARMASVVPVPDERAALEAAASPAAQAVVARIRSARFEPTLLREGYRTSEVDEFFDQLIDAALEERQLLPLIDAASFTRGRFHRGYASADVDAFLRGLAGR